MFIVYVYRVCLLCMFIVCAYYVCLLCVFIVYVYCVCVLCMFIVYVCCVCLLCMCVVYVYCVCVLWTWDLPQHSLSGVVSDIVIEWSTLLTPHPSPTPPTASIVHLPIQAQSRPSHSGEQFASHEIFPNYCT